MSPGDSSLSVVDYVILASRVWNERATHVLERKVERKGHPRSGMESATHSLDPGNVDGPKLPKVPRREMWMAPKSPYRCVSQNF